MNKDFQRLLRELNHRDLLPSVEQEFFKLGHDGFIELFETVKGGGLSVRQTCNALILLVELRFYGDPNEVFHTLLNFVTDEHTRVRTTATLLVIGLTRFAEGTPYNDIELATRAYITPFLEQALSMGFATRMTENYVRDYLAGK